ncbi:MAG: outer membrane beta-barrel protein [Puniceicoccales bacterium]|jgi:opacity protein-like surface antigen|nr:outer membrane beta-barrel protein [Puniceicoccales bacterium]
MKNKLFKVMLGSAAIASVSLSADSGMSSSYRPYISLGAGFAKPGSKDDVKYKWGFLGKASLGVSYDAWRLELEAAYRRSKVDEFTATGIKKDEAKYSVLSGMVNLFYDYSFTEEFYGYAGVGIGVAHAAYELTLAAAPNTKSTSGKLVFAWQLMAGLGYDINEDWSLTAGYRLFNTTKVKVTEATAGELTKKAPFTHTVEIGLRYSF